MRYLLVLIFACISLCYTYETVNAESGRFPYNKGGYNVKSATTWGNEVFTGNVFFVDSGDSNARDDTAHGMKRAPFATMDYANGRCTANNGDIVIVLPGHTETISEAASLDLDIAGITWRSVGRGSYRATINYTSTTTADIDIDAANITMDNFLFTGGVDALTGPIDVNAADFSLLNSEYRDVTGQAEDVIVADANADRFLIDGLMFRGAAADGPDSAIQLTGTATDSIDDFILRNFYIYGNFDDGAIQTVTAGLVRATIGGGNGWNYFWTEGSEDIFITNISTSTGFLGPNIAARLQDNAANITECYGTDTNFQFILPLPIVNADAEVTLNFNAAASTD